MLAAEGCKGVAGVVVGASSSSAKNSKVLVLNARANLLNISVIWGWEDPSISGISLFFLHLGKIF